MIKKIFYINFFYFSSALFYLAHAGTPSVDNNPSVGQFPNPLKSNSLNAFFTGISSVAIQLGTIIAGLAIMYGGFLYVTAGGDEEKLGKAQKTITWALVGTAVLLGANVIMTAIQGTISSL